MILTALRILFLFLGVSITTFFLLSPEQFDGKVVGIGFAGSLMITLLVIYIDIRVPREHKIATFSGVLLGLIAGLVFAFALSFVVDLIAILIKDQFSGGNDLVNKQMIDLATKGMKLFIGLITCYIGISVVLQTKDDFRFVIPYIEFTKQLRGSRPTVLDTSVIIDGRIVAIAKTHILQGTLIVPDFVIDELQAIADSSDNLKRARGRRGLDILKTLQDDSHLDLRITKEEALGQGVDQKLVALSAELKARLMTNDFNLNKAASLRHIPVININELAQAVKPVVLCGETLQVKIIKQGEGPRQGVAYLDDGTMVVTEGARDKVGQSLEVTITKTLQTTAGKMIFAKVVDDNAS